MNTNESEACCTCAALLNPPLYTSLTTEKSHPPSSFRRLPCCNRAICSRCMQKNSRFETYCPFCQISNAPSSLPQGLREPPSYLDTTKEGDKNGLQQRELSRAYVETESDKPPPYHTIEQLRQDEDQPDVIHHLHPTDTLQSLSVAYKVPASILRQHNNLYSDNLLAARFTLQIPGSHYKGGVSLSPNPVESEEESEHKRKVRRFMVAAKCHKYDVAELYLKQANGDLDGALERWRDDEQWEKDNPYGGGGGGGSASKKGKGRSKRSSGTAIGLSWQLS